MSDNNSYFSIEARAARRAKRLSGFSALSGSGNSTEGRLTTQNAGMHAVQMAREVLENFRLPMVPKLSYSGIKNARTAQSSSKLEDGVITVFAEMKTLSGINVGFDIPMEIRAGELMEPSVIVVEGAPRIIAQSAFDDVVERSTIYSDPPVRELYSPPLSQSAAHEQYGNRYKVKTISNGMFSSHASKQALRDAIAGRAVTAQMAAPSMAYRVILDGPVGVCVGFVPDGFEFDEFNLVSDDGGSSVVISPSGDMAIMSDPAMATEPPDLMIWRSEPEFEAWVSSMQFDAASHAAQLDVQSAPADSQGRGTGGHQITQPIPKLRKQVPGPQGYNPGGSIPSGNNHIPGTPTGVDPSKQLGDPTRNENSDLTQVDPLMQDEPTLNMNLGGPEDEQTTDLEPGLNDTKMSPKRPAVPWNTNAAKEESWFEKNVKNKKKDAPDEEPAEEPEEKSAAKDDDDSEDHPERRDVDRNEQDEDALDPAERDTNDLHRGMEVTLKEELEVRNRGGGSIDYSKGTKCEIVRDLAGDNKAFVVRFKDGQEVIVDRSFLKKAQKSKMPKAPKQPKQPKQPKIPKPKKQPKVCAKCNKSPCICHRKKSQDSSEQALNLRINDLSHKLEFGLGNKPQMMQELQTLVKQRETMRNTLAPQSPQQERGAVGPGMCEDCGEADCEGTCRSCQVCMVPLAADNKTWFCSDDCEAHGLELKQLRDEEGCPECGSTRRHTHNYTAQKLPGYDQWKTKTPPEFEGDDENLPGGYCPYCKEFVVDGEAHFHRCTTCGEDCEPGQDYCSDACSKAYGFDEHAAPEGDAPVVGDGEEITIVCCPECGDWSDPTKGDPRFCMACGARLFTGPAPVEKLDMTADMDFMAKVNEEVNSMREQGLTEIDARQAIFKKFGPSVANKIFE